jgi:hypothetical protein
MPLLDVNDAFDFSFWDDIVVHRIVEQIDNHGRVIRTKTDTATRAVVTPSTPDDLQRLPDEQYMQKAITVFTPFRLQGLVEGPDGVVTHPDEITWHGSDFVVQSFEDWSGYGRGYTQAVAVSIQSVDGPPAPGPAVMWRTEGTA